MKKLLTIMRDITEMFLPTLDMEYYTQDIAKNERRKRNKMTKTINSYSRIPSSSPSMKLHKRKRG